MKPMKKRNAITVAALASLGFGGAATAAVSATHADASATDHGSSNGEVSASDVAQKPSKPKVVKVYIDEPVQDAASGGSASGTVSSDSFAADQDNGLVPVTPTPTAPRQPAAGDNHNSSTESPGTDSDDDHGASEHAEEPTTTVAPPTTTSGGSGNAGTEDHEAEDHEDQEDHEVEDHGGDDD